MELVQLLGNFNKIRSMREGGGSLNHMRLHGLELEPGAGGGWGDGG